MPKSPRKIYLLPDMGDGEGRSWCDTRVTEEDVEYVRADRHLLLQAKIRRLQADCLELKRTKAEGGK